MLTIGSFVKITLFDDGNQCMKNEVNIWTIKKFEYNKTKSIIENNTNKNIKPRSISSWKLEKIDE